MWDYFRYMRYVKLYINKQSIIVFMIASIIANISITYQEQRYINLQIQLQKQDKLKIYGTIVSNPQEKQYYTLYKLKTKQNHYFNIYINRAEDKLSYGQGVVIEGIFQMPKEQRNEGGFDYNQYLKTQKILGIIQINNVKRISIKHDLMDEMNEKANKVSNFLKERIQETIKNKKASGILIALILGDTSFISENIIEDFRNANIAHILAISGMHISYLIFISSFLILLISFSISSKVFFSLFSST